MSFDDTENEKDATSTDEDAMPAATRKKTARTKKTGRKVGRKKGRGPGRPKGSGARRGAKKTGRRGRPPGPVQLQEKKHPGRKPKKAPLGSVRAQANGPADYVVLVKKGRGYRQVYCDTLASAKRQIEQLLQGGSRIETLAAYKQLKVGLRSEAVIS